MGRLQLRGRGIFSTSVLCVTTFTPRSISRSTQHEARDTKLGPEEITRDIPNVGEDALKDLDAGRHHPHRRGGSRRRYSRRQGYPEGRDRAYRRGETSPRDLRREGARSARYFAPRASRRIRYNRRRQGVLKRKRRRACPRRQQCRPRTISRRRERYPSATRWRDVTETRVLFPAYFRRRICLSCRRHAA